MGCDEDHLLPFAEYRAVQERPDGPTKRFIDYVHSQPLIRCVLSGHVHFHHESILPGGAVQCVTKAGFKGGAREILFE